MKVWYKSKVLWFNVLALFTIILGNLGYVEFIPAAWVNDLGVAISLIVNLFLRFRTKESIGLIDK